jgi:hypothetical protein
MDAPRLTHITAALQTIAQFQDHSFDAGQHFHSFYYQ